MSNNTKTSPKMRIRLKSYDLKSLESAVSKVMGLVIKSWASVKGPIPLPKKVNKYTVLKSHFVYKDARDQYERITYSRVVDVIETWEKTVETLQNITIPVGVSVDVKVY